MHRSLECCYDSYGFESRDGTSSCHPLRDAWLVDRIGGAGDRVRPTALAVAAVVAQYAPLLSAYEMASAP